MNMRPVHRVSFCEAAGTPPRIAGSEWRAAWVGHRDSALLERSLDDDPRLNAG